MNYGNRSHRGLLMLTVLTILSAASVATVYAVLIGAFTGGEMKVDTRTFNRVSVGDSVWVSEYSDGSYRIHYS